jgi:hypothetical protein
LTQENGLTGRCYPTEYNAMILNMIIKFHVLHNAYHISGQHDALAGRTFFSEHGELCVIALKRK